MTLDSLKIPRKVRAIVDRELQPGETIRWVAQPIPRMFDAASIPIFLFALPWTAFAIFWICGAAGFRLPDLRDGLRPEYLFPLFGVPFVLIGLAMLSAPFWIWQITRQTVYIITSKRAIVFEGGPSITVRSFLPEQLNDIFRKEKGDGTGDVILAVRHWKDSDGDARSEELGFRGIRDPQEVERMVRRLAQTEA